MGVPYTGCLPGSRVRHGGRVPRRRSGGPLLVEDVSEAGLVTEAPQLDAHGRAVAAVLRARHVGDVGLPAARAAAAGQSGAAPAPAPDGRRVLVAVIAG